MTILLSLTVAVVFSIMIINGLKPESDKICGKLSNDEINLSFKEKRSNKELTCSFCGKKINKNDFFIDVIKPKPKIVCIDCQNNIEEINMEGNTFN